MVGRYYKRISNHITSLHKSKSNLEFQKKFKLIKEKWKSWNLIKFLQYFEAKWINSVFKNWQLYSTPVGFETTNNPIEQYNAVIKKFLLKELN